MKKYIQGVLLLLLFIIIGIYVFVIFTTNKFIETPTKETQLTNFHAPALSEVYILGVVHKPTDRITHDSLYNLLERIKPNIILYEFDSTGFDAEMKLKKRMSYLLPPFLKDFQQSNLEYISVEKYLFHNPFAIVRPYEWALREQFHKENQIISKPNEIFEKLAELDAAHKLSSEQKGILENYYALTQQLEKFGDSTLYEINTHLQDSIAEKRQNGQYHEIKKIIDTHSDLITYRDFYKINEEYWDIRNKAMANNIATFIQRYPNSRIVVLNGYYHRYYLRNELRKQQEILHFNLKDIEL